MLRFLFFGVMLAALLVAAIPLLVLINLAEGGDGFGLCPGGLGRCDFGYTLPLELSASLVVILFVLVALIRVGTRLWRRMRDEGTPLTGSR
ncbi:MAG: hypothetical protein OEO77_09005 [Acidimicrobiia bacterium]|nr:hypothetical protein [Acidimicrobiia bacterium]